MDSNPTCTQEDVDSLKEAQSSLTKAAKVVDKALKMAEANYEKTTGVTLSLADFTTAPPVTTTAATTTSSGCAKTFRNLGGNKLKTCEFLLIYLSFR